jgi:hypothetical protein
MSSDLVRYLNAGASSSMAGALLQAIEALPAKLQKQPAAQWIATVKALVSKGVKQAEIDDCDVLTWLATEGGSIARAQVVDHIRSRQITIKEVVLGAPKYRGYSHAEMAGPGASYCEILFIANSEKANIEDRMEEIEYEIEQFNFNLELLSTEPQRIFALEAERKKLMLDAPKAHDFKNHHFSSSIEGKHGKNLIAHGRELVAGNLYLIEEIQSDWGQKGRKADWNGVPRGPFVTDTKLWAGLVGRRMLQRAALNPAIERFSWIRGSMRNGGRIVAQDKLDDFYLKTVAGIFDKVVGKAGGKSRLANLTLGTTVLADVPTIDMTPEVRAAILAQPMPLYSHAPVRAHRRSVTDIERAVLLARGAHMLGSIKHVRLVDRLWDIASGRGVAGRTVCRLAQVSLNALDPREALDHECFHFASEYLMGARDRAIVDAAFATGSVLQRRVRDELARRGQPQAAAQCANPQEAAAHAFSLWSRGGLDVSDQAQVHGLFQELRSVLLDAVAWFRRVVCDQQCSSVQDVFLRLNNGEYGQEYLANTEEVLHRHGEVLGM